MNEAIKSPWQKEYDALPAWAQKIVTALAEIKMYGSTDPLKVSHDAAEGCMAHFVVLPHECGIEWFEGILGAKDIADALTAPWPAPAPTPHEMMGTSNIVEIAAGNFAFDQPCHYGCRIESHATYCHNDVWPNAPRKCHRNRDDFRHENCPGFFANEKLP